MLIALCTILPPNPPERSSGNNFTLLKKPIKGRQLKILLKAIDKSNTNLAKDNIFAGFVF